MKISSESQLNSPRSKQNEINALEAQKRQLQNQIQQLEHSSTNNENEISILKSKTASNEGEIQQNKTKIQDINTPQQQKNANNSPAYIVEISMHHKNNSKAATL